MKLVWLARLTKGRIHERRWSASSSPVTRFGPLRVSGGRIVGSGGPVRLSGVSLFWPNEQGRFFTAETVRWLARDWGVGIVRVPIGTTRDGPALPLFQAVALAERVIEAAVEEGVYVLVDWHAHDRLAEAVPCLAAIASRFGDLPNLLFEPWNEPESRWGWADVKTYHEQATDAIRQHAPSALIVAGTPNYSKHVDVAARAPVARSDVAYALHFYAGTHRDGLRERAERALADGAALIASEWGACEANGDGIVDWDETERWLTFLDRHGIGDVVWSISAKSEACSMLLPDAASNGGWSLRDLTPTGQYCRRRLRRAAG